MGARSAIRWGILCSALACCAFAATTSDAAVAMDAPDATDQARLAAGETVAYPQTLYRQGKRYVGGVTYIVVDASVAEITSLLADPSAYRQVLPHARDARVLGNEGEDRLVEITQGTALVHAAYTLRLRTDSDQRRIRFWLDRSKPHGIDDAWGFFRVDPLPDAPDGSPRVLLAYGILVDLGPGLIRDFFESRIQASLLTVPERLREYASLRFRGRPRA